MALTGQQVLDAAKALAFPYVGQQSGATGPLLQRLNTLDAEIVDLVVRTAPHLLSAAGASVPITTPAANKAGYTLTAARHYTDFKYRSADTGELWTITIVPEAQLDYPGSHPAAALLGTKLYPSDPMLHRWDDNLADSWWVSGDSIEYRYVPNSTPLTAFSGTLASPDYALPYLTWGMVLQLMLMYQGHDGVVPQIRMEATGAAMQSARADLTMTIARMAPLSAGIRADKPF